MAGWGLHLNFVYIQRCIELIDHNDAEQVYVRYQMVCAFVTACAAGTIIMCFEFSLASDSEVLFIETSQTMGKINTED